MHFGNNSILEQKKRSKKVTYIFMRKAYSEIFSKENKQEFRSTHRQAKVFYILRGQISLNRKTNQVFFFHSFIHIKI